MRMLLVGLLLFTFACAGRYKPPTDAVTDRVTICVTNHSITPYRIFVYGRGRGSVYPGETRRISVQTQLLILPLGAYGLGGGDSFQTYPMDLSTSDFWTWEITNVVIYGVTSIQPVENCE